VTTISYWRVTSPSVITFLLRSGNSPETSRRGQASGAQRVTVAVVRWQEVTAAETAELRRQVLRGGRPVALPGDGDPAFHVGVYEDEELLATGNVRVDPAPWDPGRPAWRLRGMATAPEHRGRGAGALVLAALMAHAREHGGGVLWCNARTPAQGFYERAGLVTRGEPWADPENGPHVVMWRPL
jgi:GNAT superfamily N-acetyltransferase